MEGPSCVLLALGLLFAPASPTRQEVAVGQPSRLEFRVSPAIDLYFTARALAASVDGQPPPEELAASIEALRALDRDLGGSFLAWGPLEGSLPGCRTASDLTQAFARAPESLNLPGRQAVQLRALALPVAEALVAAEPWFLEQLWPEHEARLKAALTALKLGFEPHERACIDQHLAALRMHDPELVVPVWLTARAPSPGAVTHRGEQGRGVCFVSVDGAEGSQLFETVLHEATHAFDVACEDSALQELRKRLAAAGIGPRDRAMRDVPHTLMFVQSAESIRRWVDPAHEDYGLRSHYYERVGPVAELVREHWLDFVEGRSTREEALEGIAGGARELPR